MRIAVAQIDCGQDAFNTLPPSLIECEGECLLAAGLPPQRDGAIVTGELERNPFNQLALEFPATSAPRGINRNRQIASAT
jgi:hypothetical protein